jgi:hypothetical protein
MKDFSPISKLLDFDTIEYYGNEVRKLFPNTQIQFEKDAKRDNILKDAELQLFNESIEYGYENVYNKGLKYDRHLKFAYEKECDYYYYFVVIDEITKLFNAESLTNYSTKEIQDVLESNKMVLLHIIRSHYTFEDYLVYRYENADLQVIKFVLYPSKEYDHFNPEDSEFIHKQGNERNYFTYSGYLKDILDFLDVNPSDFMHRFNTRFPNKKLALNFPDFNSIPKVLIKDLVECFLEDIEYGAFTLYGYIRPGSVFNKIVVGERDYKIFFQPLGCFTITNPRYEANTRYSLHHGIFVDGRKVKFDCHQEDKLSYKEMYNTQTFTLITSDIYE